MIGREGQGVAFVIAPVPAAPGEQEQDDGRDGDDGPHGDADGRAGEGQAGVRLEGIDEEGPADNQPDETADDGGSGQSGEFGHENRLPSIGDGFRYRPSYHKMAQNARRFSAGSKIFPAARSGTSWMGYHAVFSCDR